MYRLAAAACVGAVLTGCSSEAGTTNAGPAEPEAALDGSYVVDWDGTGTKNGAPADDLKKAKNGWVFRTACHDSGCVATGGSIADTANPLAPLKNVRVADYVDGRWLMVYFTEDALAPTVTLIGTGDCEVVNVQSLTMTRTGDPLPGFPLPDPADQPQRAVPAAAAFSGDYTVTVQDVANHEVQTYCLRTEARCVTTSTSSERRDPEAPYQFWVYQFADDAFARRSAASRTCDDGKDGVAAEVDTLPLPSDASAVPLRTLSGERITTFTGGCDARVVENIEYQLNSQ